MSPFNTEAVLAVHHRTETLFSFTTTRDPAFRFICGQFTMIGRRRPIPGATATRCAEAPPCSPT